MGGGAFWPIRLFTETLKWLILAFRNLVTNSFDLSGQARFGRDLGKSIYDLPYYTGGGGGGARLLQLFLNRDVSRIKHMIFIVLLENEIS